MRRANRVEDAMKISYSLRFSSRVDSPGQGMRQTKAISSRSRRKERKNRRRRDGREAKRSRRDGSEEGRAGKDSRGELLIIFMLHCFVCVCISLK